MSDVPQGMVATLKVVQDSINREKAIMETDLKSADKSSDKLKKGTIIHTAFDDYKIIKQEGLGGNGRVFSAETTDGEKVAIKFVERTTSSEKLKRFKNEINFCEQHKHKNIVPILDRGYVFLDDKDFVFYVMPLYKETLKKKIKEGIPQEKVIDIFVGILEGLKFAHDHKAIHRDIKPENILFSEDSFEPVICDFGIAHFAEEDLLTVVETKVTDRMANFQYAAPEQRKKGGNVCPQTDIYALALILNEMFTGEIPQAVGYKKIKDVASEYAFLDDIFEQLYIQDPEKRLYPEELILTELKVLSERYRREEEKKKLQATIIEVNNPATFEAKIVNLEYHDAKMIFVLDRAYPSEWFSILTSPYSVGYILGYENTKLKKIDSKSFYMPLQSNTSDNTLHSLLSHVKDWVKYANSTYTSNIKRNAMEQQKRKEEQRLAKIREIEFEEKMSSKLNSLLSEL